jgi:hypothetical protein
VLKVVALIHHKMVDRRAAWLDPKLNANKGNPPDCLTIDLLSFH